MRIPLRAAFGLALVAGLGLAGLSQGPAHAAVPSEKSLPATTFVFVKVDSASKLRAAFEGSQMGRLLKDPALKPLKDDVLAKLDEVNVKVKQKVGFTIGELLELPQGAGSLAVVSREGAKVPVAVLISADAGSNEKKMDDLMNRLTGLATADEAKISTETFKGLKLTILRSSKPDEQENPPVVWTKQGTVFHIATDLDVLKDVLSHADGREDALAANESYSAIQRKVGQNAQLTWFLDIAQVIKLAGSAGEGNAEQMAAQLQLLGLNNLKGVGGGMAFNVGEYDAVARTYIYMPGPSQGVVKIFSLPPADLRPQAWVPATAASYQSISWDLDNAYNAIKDLADMFAPGQLDNLEKQIAGPEGQGLSIKNDIFGPIGDRITVVGDFKKPITEKSQRALFAVSLEDPKKFQNTLNKLFDLTKASPKKREFQGTTIYDFDLAGVPNAEEANLPEALSLAIAKDSLFLATDPALLEQILRSGGQSLADNPEYQAVAKQYPEKASFATFARPEESARLIYDMLKSGDLKKALEASQTPDGPDLSKALDVIDPNKLPEFSIIAKYLAPTGGFGLGDEDGMMITQFTLKKASP